MSYDKDIGNYTVKFKDEISYLEAKLENLKLYSDIPFIGFIQNEMYDGSKCEVESIDPVQYTGTVGSFSNHVYVSDNSISEGSLVGFASGSVSSTDSNTITTSAYSPYTNTIGIDYCGIDYGAVTGDVHISGNLIVDGAITWTNDYSGISGGTPITFTQHAADPPESPKEEPPEDPIDNRFDILDL